MIMSFYFIIFEKSFEYNYRLRVPAKVWYFTYPRSLYTNLDSVCIAFQGNAFLLTPAFQI